MLTAGAFALPGHYRSLYSALSKIRRDEGASYSACYSKYYEGGTDLELQGWRWNLRTACNADSFSPKCCARLSEVLLVGRGWAFVLPRTFNCAAEEVSP